MARERTSFGGELRASGARPRQRSERWRTAIQAVLAEGGPEVDFEPVVDLARGQVAGYEVHARFDRYGQARPPEWFKRAAQVGLGADLEASVVANALAAARTIPPGRFLTVNLTPDTLLSGVLHDVLEAQATLQGLVIELDAWRPFHDPGGLRAVLANARAAGALLAVDDPGAGYSGLEWLIDLRPEMVELDRMLVAGVATDPAKLAWAEMLGAFASRIDAWVVASGIEHESDLDALVSIGVPLGQGALLGRPEPAWTEGEVGTVERLRLRERTALVELAAIGSLAQLVELVPLPAAPRRSDRPVLLVDIRSTPVGFCMPDELPVVPPGGLLRVDRREAAAQVLGRALSRDPGTRWHPVICIDEAGAAVGIVPIDVLGRAVAAQAMRRTSSASPLDRLVQP